MEWEWEGVVTGGQQTVMNLVVTSGIKTWECSEKLGLHDEVRDWCLPFLIGEE